MSNVEPARATAVQRKKAIQILDQAQGPAGDIRIELPDGMAATIDPYGKVTWRGHYNCWAGTDHEIV